MSALWSKAFVVAVARSESTEAMGIVGDTDLLGIELTVSRCMERGLLGHQTVNSDMNEPEIPSLKGNSSLIFYGIFHHPFSVENTYLKMYTINLRVRLYV